MNFAEWYGASSFTAETQLLITEANSGIKFLKHHLVLVKTQMEYIRTLGSAADNQITLDQGSNGCRVSQLMFLLWFMSL